MSSFLDEYAIVAYALMDQAARLQAAHMQDQILIALIPHMEEDQRQEIIENYANASHDILETEIDLEADDYSAISQLKNFLG